MSDARKDSDKSKLFVFPAWHNNVPPIFFLVIGPVATIAVIFSVWHWFSPKFTDAGYMPEQPVAYSHALHAGELKIDCRYCHVGVEKTAHAGVPPTATCMNCHTNIKTKSPKLALVRESYAEEKSIPWVRIHKVADYAYFNHAPHVKAGVGCESCHGRIDTMVEVYQHAPLSMGWCYECHQAGQEAYHAQKAVGDLLTGDLQTKRNALMQTIDDVGIDSGAALAKQTKARQEIAALDVLIDKNRRATIVSEHLNKKLAAAEAIAASATGSHKKYQARIAKDLKAEIGGLAEVINPDSAKALSALQDESDRLFEKFVKVANLRPSHKVTAMGYSLNDGDLDAMKYTHQGNLLPPIHCSGCHR